MMGVDERDHSLGSHALSTLWQRKGMIAAVVGGVTALSLLVLFLVTPRYEAETLIALKARPGPVQQVASTTPLPAMPLLDTASVRTEMDVLQSREVAAQVVDELNLVDDPEFNPFLEETGEGMLASAQARLERGVEWMRVQWAELTGARLPQQASPRSDAARLKTIENVMERMRLKSDTESFAIHLTFQSEDPEKAALIANTFADVYIRGQMDTKTAEFQQATNWISNQLQQIQSELNFATEDLAKFRQENRLSPLDSDPSLLAAQQLVALNTELATLESERATAESQLQQLRRLLAAGGSAAQSEVAAASPFIGALRAQEAELLGEAAALSARYTDNHPALRSLRDQISRIRSDINAEVRNVISGLESRVAEARAREETLRTRMTDISNQANANSRELVGLQQREMDIENRNLMMQSFMARYNELVNRIQIEQPDARVVSRAEPPLDPAYPQKPLFLAVAFTGSLGLAMSLAFMFERFRPGYVSTQQIRQELALPTLGVIPEVRRLEKRSTPSDQLLGKPTSAYTEAVRAAQLAILNARQGPDSKAILVTSSLPGEGKSAFALSLGRSLAQHGFRTLLVDCDLRRPSLARLTKTRHAPGLVDFLREEVPMEEALRQDDKSGLHFIPAGSRCDDPQRLLGSALAAHTFDAFKSKFDVVLIDSPPTMVASDSALLAKSSELALYVVEWDRTPRRAVQAGVEYLRSLGVNVAGVVFSKVDLEKRGYQSDYADFCFRNPEYYRN
ncbi:polysaccharide biosynthesis tyrosine autokinase [Telmatospirillum sp. J64-1]|uniref:GumC family protein n=1 Tax=Telmatospirillum sp. J64-1 TaxID=2502183 RepID=UPI00115E2261|nr:polysaccharide biosynthesis tyrosine autokinase [Telmatospirillum sp. J64-1]